MTFDPTGIFENLSKGRTPEEAWRRCEKIFAETPEAGRDRLGDLFLEYARRTDDGVSAPYAFGFANRCWLSARANWAITHPPDAIPRDFLLGKIGGSLEDPRIISKRSNYFYLIVEGIFNFIQDNIESSFKSFALGSTPRDFKNFVIGEFGAGASCARTFPSSDDLARARGTKLPRAVTPHTVPPGNAALVISVSANTVYAEAFFTQWLRALSDLPESICIHLNLCLTPIDDWMTSKSFIDMLIREFSAESKRIFFTTTRFDSFDIASFASARFLCGEDIHNHLQCPILFCDSDMQLLNAAGLSDLIGQDERIVGAKFNTRPNGGYLPWRRFSAGRVSIRSRIGAKFIGMVGDCIEYFWHDDSERNWWIDQLSLETTRILCQNSNHEVRFQPFDSNIDKTINQTDDFKWSRLKQVRRVNDLVNSGIGLRAAVRAAGRQPLA